MTTLRLTAAVAALSLSGLTIAGYAGSALAQQTAPASDPTAQTTTQSAPSSSTTSPSYGTDPAATPPGADSATASGTPSSATAGDTSTAAAPSADAKPEKKAKKHHKPAGDQADPAGAPTSETPKP